MVSSASSSQTAPGPARPVLELENIVKRREKGDQVFELRVPSLQVGAGEFVVIAGESGCGKSTLLDMLGLVLSPTSGDRFLLRSGSGREHAILGLSSGRLAALRRSELGYVLQTGGLLPFLSVRDNVLLPCKINGRHDRHGPAMDLCERLKITAQLHKKPQFLSGGQRQRAAIARALAHQPPIVLADEPTAAVDKLTAREICNTFKELTRMMGVTLLMVTHDVDLVRDMMDRSYSFTISRPENHHTISVCTEDKP
ncbi:MAG: ABC transporter ATP-binding protein [Verrucomicrobia bacterium]|nr:ABC transporter ATP-binding protein [Verrucomicrobiota bacterium]MCH8510759.1 ABC transporter ATP-binding protein [Kiritimatiellia bacterium]